MFQGLYKVLHAIEVAVVQFAQVHLVIINIQSFESAHTFEDVFFQWRGGGHAGSNVLRTQN